MNRLSKVFLVALRLAIGWHFLYEGVWKIDSADRDGQAFIATRYGLQASVGRLSDYFSRAPAEGLKLDAALTRIDQWHDEVVRVFQLTNKPMTEEQKVRIAEMRDKVKVAAAEALRSAEPAFENVVDFDWFVLHEEILKVAAQEDAERFTSLEFLQASAGPFRGVFRGLVPDLEGIDRLTVESAHKRIDERYEEIVDHFESAGVPLTNEQRGRLATVRESVKASIAATLADPLFRGRVEHYKAFLARVRADERRAETPFAQERLAADSKKLGEIAGELLAFVNEPIAELAIQTQAIATVDQMRAGPVPEMSAPTAWIDWMVKWGLTAIGVCLLLGLFTPVAAVAAAAQIAMFYLASPPLPGLPAATLGGHYLYVDRNLIELIAALVIGVTGTGKWAGLDFYLNEYVIPKLRRRPKPVEEKAPAFA